MKTKELNQMIQAAIEWAGNVNGKQGLLDISYAMGLDETHCSGCEDDTPHFDKCCVVCGQYNEQMIQADKVTFWRVTEIDWDTDGNFIAHLPTERTIMLHEGQDEDDIADILSDNYGWLINSFKSEQIEMPTK